MRKCHQRTPIPRKDAFFGLHFDLHPNQHDTVLGAETREQNIAKLLARVRPDYIQYDCKGHPGYTGYPTKVGWPSPGIVKDALASWRKVTRERGVGLYVHYSGLWDQVAMEHHPGWARVDENRALDPRIASTFGPYVGELLIPQLKEVTSAYDLDGVWVDGDCWAAALDYSEAALAKWKEETGEADPPKGQSDPRWQDWKAFHRRQFEAYVCHYIDALHTFNPRLQLTSNWMYTTMAPRPVVANLDFLSGDVSPQGPQVDMARIDARYLASTEMPWDLMSWGQAHPNLKPAAQLAQEAAAVLMQGGGYQIYYNPTRAGHVPDDIIETAGQVADFCRARQEVSHKSVSVPQVALLLSSASQFDRSDSLFHNGGQLTELEGALHALLESHCSVDILAEHQLQPRLHEFPLVVIPDSHRLDQDFREAVLAYVKAGGKLLLLGEKCARLFEPALGVRFEGEPEQVEAKLPTPVGVADARGIWQKVTPTTARTIASRYPTRDARAGGEVAATVVSYDRGKIAAVYGPVALTYSNTHYPGLRRLVGDLVHRLFPRPAVEVEAPPYVDIAVRRTAAGQLSVHLLNLANAPRAERFATLDVVPATGPVTVRLRVPEKPRQVHWVPAGGRLKWSWDKGTLSVTVPRLEVHGVLVAEEGGAVGGRRGQS